MMFFRFNIRTSTHLSMMLTGLILAGFPTNAFSQKVDRYEELRQRMVEEFIVSEGVTNPRVIQVMRKVPRHEFLRAENRNLAYYDQGVDIGFKQTISSPFIVAYMTESLDPQPEDKVLEIGTGSGYQAAVLSGLVKDVYSIEIVEPLGKRAAAVLSRLKYSNIHTKIGDGYLGWPDAAPFDKIIVTCSPENVPQPLVDQLKEGGKMIIPLGERYQQVLHLLEKKDGQLVRQKLLPTLFVPMTGKMEDLRQKQPDPAHPHLINGGFEIDADGDGTPDNWHSVRRASLVEDAFAGKTSMLFENSEPGRLSSALQAMAIDGSKVRRLQVNWAMKLANISEGQASNDLPTMSIFFYDGQRLPISRVIIGTWKDPLPEWKYQTVTIDIPPTAREAIFQMGLVGATGKFWVDELQVSPVP